MDDLNQLLYQIENLDPNVREQLFNQLTGSTCSAEEEEKRYHDEALMEIRMALESPSTLVY
ncbi:MAG: hypothetical protein RIF33_03815 [Cyclobacteriaceae bacterium]